MSSSLPTNPTLLLTPQQAAEILAISPRKLWNITASGEIPAIRVGRCKRYAVADLEAWIEQKKQWETK